MPRNTPASRPVTCDEAIDALRGVVHGNARREIVARLTAGRETAAAFDALRQCMRTHRWPTVRGTADLRRVVDGLDARTRREGLHVLHGWDFRAQRRPDDIVPVLLADYCQRIGVPDDRLAQALAILVDQYLLSIMMLPVVRAWDDGDTGGRLDAISALLAELNGAGGGGLATVDDAESLLLLAVAYYHPEEAAYDRQLERVRTVDAAHALRFAFPCAAIMASHLRWGLRFMYRNDIGTMRADNIVDYPWCLFSLATLMREYGRLCDSGAPRGVRVRCAGALLDGLSPDPWAFDGPPPAFLSAHRDEHAWLRGELDRRRDSLLADGEACEPAAGSYSPLGFSCNFLSNAVVASVVAAVNGAGETRSLNALFAADPPARSGDADAGRPGAEALAMRLMAFAAGSVERLGAGGVPLIVYDRRDAAHFHNAVMRCLRQARAP